METESENAMSETCCIAEYWRRRSDKWTLLKFLHTGYGAA